MPTAVFGGYIPDVGGGTTYPRYVGHYEDVSALDSPLSMDISFAPSVGGTFTLSADVEVTGDIETSDNFIQFILTYYYSDTYFCTVEYYEEEVFDLTTIGQTQTYSRSITIDDWMDLSKVTGVIIVQTNEGQSTGGQYPITTRQVLQGAKAQLAADATLTGIITDAYTDNPIAGATVIAGSFETTTTFNGTYTLNTIPMTYEVEVSHPSYETATETVTTVSDETTTLNVGLQEMLLPPYNVLADVDGGSVSLSWPYPEVPTATLRLEILTDNYPSETSWDLLNAEGDIVASINSGDLSNSNTLYEWEYELEFGTYTWTIYDSYGDGICCSYGDGYYNLILEDELIATGGNFGSSESVTFDAVLPPGRRDLLGYNVWEESNPAPLNGSEILLDQNFIVSGLYDGFYTFTVTAVYSSGESPHSEPAFVTIEGQGSGIEVTNLAGWNLVGLPVSTSDPNYLTHYPNSVENTLFAFNDGYQAETEMLTGEGYWLRFEDEGVNALAGGPNATITLSLAEGWNLISGPTDTCVLALIDDPNGLIVPGTCYGYNNGYENVEATVPGYGYWIRSTGVGTLEIGGSWNGRIVEHKDWLENANTITINGKELYFGVEIPEEEMLRYSLPPSPPAGAIDVRFNHNYKVSNSSMDIDVSGVTNDYIVSSTIANLDDEWILIDEFGRSYNLSDGSEFVINSDIDRLRLEKRTADLPTSFVLEQNYPNPFNPVTKIDYAVSIEGNVRLTVFDLLGKEVKTLVNDNHEPGYYSLTFDASSLSSGVYLYTLESGSTLKTNKLILLK